MKILIIVGFVAPLAFILFGAYTSPSSVPSSLNPLVSNSTLSHGAEQVVFVEINQVPPPFDIGGLDPYVIWINGKREKVPVHYIKPIIEEIGMENIKALDIPNLHDGWLRPHFFEQVEEEARVGRTKSLNDRRQSQ